MGQSHEESDPKILTPNFKSAPGSEAISVCHMSMNMSIVTCYMFVYMYVHALMPPACGLSLICNKVLSCSVISISSSR